jgi:probable H4MPT-linked C1 transfer pathway protein
MMVGVLGLDIGGANIKAAHSSGPARTVPFALWKEPARLPEVLRQTIASLPTADALGLTMTGELCDCFQTKREGVSRILKAVEQVWRGNVRVWTTDGRFVSPADGRERPLQVASANWHALATWAGRLAPSGPGLLIDVGSTTTDLVPLHDGKPTPQGRTDPERLQCGELVYSGVRRTPLCALLNGGFAAELFATTLDINLLLNTLPEDPQDRDTADGRPATRAAAHARVARMICADAEMCSLEQAREIAERALLRQIFVLDSALGGVVKRLPSPPQTVILAGSGEFLGRLLLQEQKRFPPGRVVSLTETLGQDVSEAACAYALSVLGQER